MSEKDLSQSLMVVPSSEPQCIWMRAGVVNHKLCPHNYGCYHCLFDKAIREKGVARAGSRFDGSWQDMLRMQPANERWCRHMIQGLVTHKVCPNNYNCGTCEYDQMVQDRLAPSVMDEASVRRIAGFMVPDGFYFDPSHKWVRLEYGGALRVGFDDFASQVMTPRADVVAPRIGQKLETGKEAFSIRSEGREYNMRTPLDGTVIAVNPLLSVGRGAAPLHPFKEGWVYILEPTRKLQAGLKGLYWGDKTIEWMQKESDSLLQRLKPGVRTAADGGAFAPGVLDNVRADDRAGLIRDFLIR